MRVRGRYFESGLLKRPKQNKKKTQKQNKKTKKINVMKTAAKDGQVKEGEDSFRDFYFESFL